MDGEGIKLTRKRLQLTQAEMAAKLGVSRQSYIAWEKDTYHMPADKVDQLLAMDASVPAGGLALKETPKQQRDRLAAEAKEIQFALERYRSLRAWPDIPNHNAAMRFYARNNQPGPPAIAHAAILAAFPDIITDPDGDHAMTKEQSQAISMDGVVQKIYREMVK